MPAILFVQQKRKNLIISCIDSDMAIIMDMLIHYVQKVQHTSHLQSDSVEMRTEVCGEVLQGFQ